MSAIKKDNIQGTPKFTEFLRGGAQSITKGFKVAGPLAICAALGAGITGSGAQAASMGNGFEMVNILPAKVIQAAAHVSSVGSDVDKSQVLQVAAQAISHGSIGDHFFTFVEDPKADVGPTDESLFSDELKAEILEMFEEFLADKEAQEQKEARAVFEWWPGAKGGLPPLSVDFDKLSECLERLQESVTAHHLQPGVTYYNKNGDPVQCSTVP